MEVVSFTSGKRARCTPGGSHSRSGYGGEEMNLSPTGYRTPVIQPVAIYNCGTGLRFRYIQYMKVKG